MPRGHLSVPSTFLPARKGQGPVMLLKPGPLWHGSQKWVVPKQNHTWDEQKGEGGGPTAKHNNLKQTTVNNRRQTKGEGTKRREGFDARHRQTHTTNAIATAPAQTVTYRHGAAEAALELDEVLAVLGAVNVPGPGGARATHQLRRVKSPPRLPTHSFVAQD